MDEGVIRSRLDLLISLVDTTTGLAVEERNVRFTFNGKEVRPAPRGYGNYIFINSGRDNGLMLVEVFGYEPCRLRVDHEVLDQVLPAIDAFLIPSEKLRTGESLLTFSGRLIGLKEMQAINIQKPVCSIREYDQRRRVMTVFAPNRRMDMVHRYYGLANIRDGTFECFEVEKELPDKRLRTKAILEKEFVLNSPICRILYGAVEEDGSFLFRVRNSASSVVYLMRYVVGDTEKFQYIDFNNIQEVRL